MKETIWWTIHALGEDAESMEVGEIGHNGQVVKVTVQCQDTGLVMILLLLTVDLIVKVTTRKTNLVTEEDAVNKVILMIAKRYISIYQFQPLSSLEVIL